MYAVAHCSPASSRPSDDAIVEYIVLLYRFYWQTDWLVIDFSRPLQSSKFRTVFLQFHVVHFGAAISYLALSVASPGAATARQWKFYQIKHLVRVVYCAWCWAEWIPLNCDWLSIGAKGLDRQSRDQRGLPGPRPTGSQTPTCWNSCKLVEVWPSWSCLEFVRRMW